MTMRTGFNTEVWQNWKKQGFGYLVTEELEEMDSHPEIAEFIVYPLKGEAEAREFLPHKIRGTPFDLQYKFVCYEIQSDSARDIAEGIFGCKFYAVEIPSQKCDEQKPHKARSFTV
jgi:hypothetical protein